MLETHYPSLAKYIKKSIGSLIGNISLYTMWQLEQPYLVTFNDILLEISVPILNKIHF